jgi:hypothetical protein
MAVTDPTAPSESPSAAVAPRARSGLGLKVGGSAGKGHPIEITRSRGLTEIFGTEDEGQAMALLGHCFRVLKGSEAGDTAGGDERTFMLSTDLAPV